MSVSLLPTRIAGAVTELTPELLEGWGVRLLMLDFDNTLVPYTTDIPTDAVVQWLDRMRSSPVAVCVVSNSKRSRVPDFCRDHGLNCITHAGKPGGRGIQACLNAYDMPPSQAALVGDQIYTDTLGANLAGVQSILVPAIDNHNLWLKLRHGAEMPVIFAARKRRIDTNEQPG